MHIRRDSPITEVHNAENYHDGTRRIYLEKDSGAGIEETVDRQDDAPDVIAFATP
jgi:hypothetical protein